MPEISFALLFIAVFGGYLLGIFSGLLPGIHTNNFALALAAFAPFLADQGIPPFYIVITVLSNAISHTFHAIVPSVFLGAPDGDTALAVLPGHRLLLEGAGAEAVRLSALGSAGSVAASLLFVLPLSLFFKAAYPFLEEYMAWVLLSVVFIMLAGEKGEQVPGQGLLAKYRYKISALFLFLITGFLGLFAFAREDLLSPVINFGTATVLLPLLSGLFGASQLVISLFTGSEIPEESTSGLKLSRKRIMRGIFTGSAAGSLVAWLPGVSSSIAALLARLFVKEDFDRKDLDRKDLDRKDPGLNDPGPKGVKKAAETGKSGTSLFWDPEADPELLASSKEFIVSVSGVNTSNAIFGLVAFLVIGKTRSGAMAAVSEILGVGAFDLPTVLLCFFAVLLASLFSYFSTVYIGNNAHRVLRKLDYTKLCAGVLFGLAVMVLLFTGLFGFFLFLISTPIGMLPSFMKVRKSHAMGVILLPVILYFLGF